MKKNKAFSFTLFCLLCIAIACNNKSETIISHYDFIHPSYLNLEFENTSDSIYISSWHWNTIPGEEMKTDSLLILGKGKKVLKINITKPQRVEFYFNKKRFDFFLVSADTTYVKIDFAKGIDSMKPVFTGKFALVNLYYLEKHKRFNTWDFYRSRAGYTQSSLDAIELGKNNDDLTNLELGFLNDFSLKNTNLPGWFQDYERQSISLTSGYFKINSIYYRNYMLGIKDSIPDGYYSFIDSIDVNSKISMLTDYYFFYLSDLISYQFRSNQNKAFDKLCKLVRKQNYYNYLFGFISELDPPAKELYSLFKLFYFYKFTPEDVRVIDTLKENITTLEYIYLLDSLGFNNYQLPENTKAPEFYLQDIDGNFKTLKDFQGKVILLDFWSTSCLPCLKEFPYEDTLAKEFANSDFQLINICLSSNVDIWETKIEGHYKSIVQLFAKDRWNDLLKDNYKIYGYPKFVLIDKNGNVANANAPRPSDPKLIGEIRRLLEGD
ncbi:MAG: TlpA family protein disulfide reductase [Bacteroidales bacterium]|nr:TlpA family protein disulfide reductase [Bacteroidales bacterium]